MSKKILASILAAASILSVSAVASATENSTETTTTENPNETVYGGDKQPDSTGVAYTVSAGITYGEVDCVIPSAKLMEAAGSVVVNPYGAAITTEIESVKHKNVSFIASKVFEVTNNDAENGLKVLATVSVKKATGLVIVDGKATKPVGWDGAKNKDGSTVDHSNDKDAKGNAISDWNPLVSYDKVTVKYKDDKVTVDSSTGGAMSAKQAMNTSVYLVGGTTAADVVSAASGTNRIDFAPKGTNTSTLLTLTKSAGANPDGFFTVKGDLNPAIDREQYAWNKENLDLNIVLKLIPQA